MKKIVSILNKATSWLTGFGCDRWLHFIAGLFISFIVGCVADGAPWAAGLVGILLSIVIGFVKEVADTFAKDTFDVMDLVFTAIGGVAGYVLIIVAWILL